MEHVIQVELMVMATPNPQGFNPGDKVTWVFAESAAGMNLQLRFKDFQPAGVSAARPSAEQGPFSSLTTSADKIEGIVAGASQEGRFRYDFVVGDVTIGWVNLLDGQHNFGGLDNPPLPPRG